MKIGLSLSHLFWIAMEQCTFEDLRCKCDFKMHLAYLHYFDINTVGRLNIQMRLQKYFSPYDEFVPFVVQLDSKAGKNVLSDKDVIGSVKECCKL